MNNYIFLSFIVKFSYYFSVPGCYDSTLPTGLFMNVIAGHWNGRPEKKNWGNEKEGN